MFERYCIKQCLAHGVPSRQCYPVNFSSVSIGLQSIPLASYFIYVLVPCAMFHINDYVWLREHCTRCRFAVYSFKKLKG